ncbi:MAG: FAD-dependent oxidoreductase [Nitrosomonadales bacterium]
MRAKHVILATGSTPRVLPQGTVRWCQDCGQCRALSFTEVPQTVVIIGAGVIGLELGSVWRRLGAEVTLLEALPTFIPVADEQVAKEALRTFAKQGLKIHLGAKIDGVVQNGG